MGWATNGRTINNAHTHPGARRMTGGGRSNGVMLSGAPTRVIEDLYQVDRALTQMRTDQDASGK